VAALLILLCWWCSACCGGWQPNLPGGRRCVKHGHIGYRSCFCDFKFYSFAAEYGSGWQREIELCQSLNFIK